MTAALVWFTTATALWLLTALMPGRFRASGGALLSAIVGAMTTGVIGQLAASTGISDLGLDTVVYAVPGAVLGLVTAALVAGHEKVVGTAPSSEPGGHTTTPTSSNGHDPDLRLVRGRD